MVDKDKDNNVVDFDALDLEGDDENPKMPQKLMEHMKFLKAKLSPEDYSKAVKDLGFDTDLSNEDLLAEILVALGLKKKEGDEDEEDDPDKKKMKDLEDQLTTLTKSVEELTKSRELEKNTAELTVEVEKLVEEKHLAPSQKDAIIKLAANMSAEDQGEMLGFFRTTQKLSGLFDDKGMMLNASGPQNEISPERRAELIKTFKINEIIEDRGVRKKVNN